MTELPVVGDRVRVVGIMPDEPNPLPINTEGVVRNVNVTSLGTQISVDWDNGSSLMLLEIDPFIIVG